MLTKGQIEIINNFLSRDGKGLEQSAIGEIEVYNQFGQAVNGYNASAALRKEITLSGKWKSFVMAILTFTCPGDVMPNNIGLNSAWSICNATPEQTARAYLAAMLDNS